jgi:hypothetical protein
MTLKEAFPDLYSIARVGDDSVIVYLGDRCLGFLLHFVVFSLSEMGRKDKLLWAPSYKGMFDVSSFYMVLASEGGFPFP